MMISDILDDGGNIQKQMQKTTTVQIQVCTGLFTNSSWTRWVAWTDGDGPHIHYLLLIFLTEIRRKYLWPHQSDDQS